MLGQRPGWVPNPAEKLADLLAAEGLECKLVSSHPNRAVRFFDTLVNIARWRRRVDVVVVQMYSGPAFVVGWATVLVARAVGLPVVLHLHGGNLPRLAQRHPGAMRRLMARATAVVAPSDYLRRELAVVRADIEVIPNVIEVDPATVSSERTSSRNLLWMRTFEPTYDPEMAIDVLARLRAHGYDARLTMAGQDQGALGRTRARAEAVGVADEVSFPGFLDSDAKVQAFTEHAIFINTTRVDNAPVTLFEAAAAGLPIVTTDAGGISTLFEHDVNALVVPVGDVDAMANSISRLFDNPDVAARLVRNSRQLALSATWERVRPRWLSVLSGSLP